MEIKGLTGFVRRVTALEAGDGADTTPKYVRLRSGPSRARSVVVATDITATGADPAELEADLRERIDGIEGEAGDKVYIEALRRGGSSVIDSITSTLDTEQVHSAAVKGGNDGSGIAAMAHALVSMAHSADDRASKALDASFNMLHALTEAKVAAASASLLLEASEHAASEQAMNKAVDAIIPLLPALAARLAMPSPAATPAQGQAASEPQGDQEGQKVKPTIAQASQLLAHLLQTASDQETAEALPALQSMITGLSPAMKGVIHGLTAP